MRVWERVAEEMTKQLEHEYKTKEAVRCALYMMRITPCDIEDEFGHIGKDKLDKECKYECLDCLDRYLDMEVGG